MFKLTHDQKIEKLEVESDKYYHHRLRYVPRLEEVEKRAEALAKLLILMNKDDYGNNFDVRNITK